ncbi:hypothetical protein BC941DRAFT_476912 [Chlamydoabsidia padenii]|nr:hypothetical protein BC941DRAFT_476912 [Chlamydoabsidia padenii]
MASLTDYPHIQPPEPHTIRTEAPSATGVRLHGLHFIRTSWQNISRASKLMLITCVFFIVAQITVSIAVLVVFQSRVCDRPFNTYLTVHTIRIGLLLPLLVYQYLTRPNFLQRQQQATTGTSQPTDDNPSSRIQPPTLIQIHNPNSNSNTTEEWCKRLKSLLDLFGILWFIVGNYLLFTSTTCPNDAPELYYTVMAWVLLSYLVLLIPILLCVSIIFCLPFVLRLLRIADVPGMTVGASQEEIQGLPVFKYKPPSGPTTTTTTTLPDSDKVPTSSWSRRFLYRFKKNKNDIESKTYAPITIPCADDAVCSICLCAHHFHKDCVHEWLGLNCLCPLCKQDFRGKQHNNDDNPATESAQQ